MAVSLPRERKLLLLDGNLARADTLPFLIPPGVVAFGPDGASLALPLELHPAEFAVVLIPRTGGFTSLSAPFADSLKYPTFSRDGSALYLLVTGPRGGFSVLDLASLAELRRVEVCSDPTGIGLMRDGRRAFLLCAAGQIAEIDLELGMLVRRQALDGSCGARGVFLSSNETALLVWCAASGKLMILDRVTLVPFDSIAADPGEAMLVPMRGGRIAGLIYAAPPRLALIDVGRRGVVGSVALEDTVLAAAVSAQGRFVYLAAGARLLRFDVQRGRIDRSLQLPGRPGGIALWPGDWEPKMRWFLR